MHVIQPQLNPMDVAVSYHMNGAYGRALGATLVALGLGSLALARAIHLAEGAVGVGLWALVACVAGAIVGGLFAPDPMGHWDQPPSFAGTAHMSAAMVAFLSFPVAALSLSMRIGRITGRPTRGARLRWLALGTAVTLVGLFVCLAPAFANRAPVLLGLVERILLAFHLVWLTIASLSVRGAAMHGSRAHEARELTRSSQFTVRLPE
jgi:hypothetical protein